MTRIPYRLQRLLLAGGGVALVLALYGLRTILLGDLPPSCIYRIITEKPCVYCGLTRALASAAHWDITVANGYNVLWWVAAAVIISVVGTALVDAVTGTRLLDRMRMSWRRSLWAVVILTVVGTAIRTWA